MTTRKFGRTLLVAALALSLVLSITGGTIAWFTDEVTSANNVITSGNLDVTLEYWDGDSFEDVTENTKIFEDTTLWEPGYTQVAYLRIANEGSLAFQYQVSVNVAKEESGTNVAGETFNLSDHLASALVNIEADQVGKVTRAQAMEKAGAKGLSSYTSEYVPMKAGDPAKYLMLVVCMPTDVGNEANHNGDAPAVTLGVRLDATQYAFESDSFDSDYDKNPALPYTIYNVSGTGAAATTLADVFADVNSATVTTALIQADKNMEWETGAGLGSTPWVNEDAAVRNLILDAGGNTLTATGAGVGPIRMANGGTLTIKNATVVDNSVSYAENSWEFGYLEFAGNLVFENVNFVNAITIDGESAVFKNCTFNSNKDSEYAVWVSSGTASFENCTFTGARGLKTHEAYGSEVKEIVVNNCTFDSLTKKPGVAIGTVNADTKVVIRNSDFINCQPGDQGKYIYESDTDVTTFDFNCNENNEVIKSVTPDLKIGTAEELFAFANDVNVNGNSYAGKLVVLTANIDLNNAEWTPVGQTGGNGVATYFQGMFDGKGYTISNLKITDNAYDEGKNYAAGLFGFVDAADAQIVNLKVDKANVNGHHWTGVIAGYLTGKISGCTVTNSTVSCTHANNDACGDKAGVITGYINSGIVTGNTVKDCTVTAGRDAGQVVGAAKTTQAYDNTVYNVTVTNVGGCTGANIRNEEIGRIM